MIKIRTIEKNYHHTNSPILRAPFRKDRESFWMRELGAAMPYVCNDNIKRVGPLRPLFGPKLKQFYKIVQM